MILHSYIAATAAWAASAAVFFPHDLTTYIASEESIALQGVLDNLGPDGELAPGAAAGVLVASPSTDNPNCENSSI